MTGLKRHFAMWQKRDQVILIGYSKKNNDVLVVKLDQLPEDERNELSQIASHPDIQRKYELTPTLTTARHTKSGETWLTNIAMRLRRHDGSVAKAFIKDLWDVEEGQMSYYKGYGPPDAPGQLRISDAEKAAVLGDDYRQRDMQSTAPKQEAPVVYRESEAPAAPAGDIAAALNAMAAAMSKMAERLPEPVKTTTTRAKVKPAPKAPQPLVLNESDEQS